MGCSDTCAWSRNKWAAPRSTRRRAPDMSGATIQALATG